jgi:hypothetical protein
MSEEQIIEALIRRKRKQPNTEAPLEDMAEESLYRGPDNKPGIPSDNVLASLRDAARAETLTVPPLSASIYVLEIDRR